MTMLLLSVILALLVALVYASSPYDTFDPDECLSTEKFDPSSLECLPCSDNQVQADDGLSCECRVGLTPVYNWETAAANDNNYNLESNNPWTLTCDDDCSTLGTPTWRDGQAHPNLCTICDSSTNAVYDTDALDCVCNDANHVLVETDSAGDYLFQKICLPCPDNALLDPTDPYYCVPCADERMTTVNGLCECPTGYQERYGACLDDSLSSVISTDFAQDAAAEFSYHEVMDSDTSEATTVIVTSGTVLNRYLQIAVDCRYEHVSEACHSLMNLCAMTMHDPTHMICDLMADILAQEASDVHNQAEWKLNLPFNAYIDDRILTNENLLSTLLFKQDGMPEDRSTIDILSFRLARFDLDGNYLGEVELTDELQLCDEANAGRWRYVGLNYDNNCDFALSQLLNRDQEFYELYYVDMNDKYMPVPVKFVNYKDDQGKHPNRKNDGSEQFEQGNLQLHRRFFLFDIVSSIETEGGDPTIVSFARSISLRVQMQQDSTTKIYPPVLSIAYEQRRYSTIVSGGPESYSEVEFRAEYFTDDTGIREARTVLFSLGVIAAFFSFALRTYVFLKTNQMSTIDLAFLARLVLFFYAALAELFFWMIFVLDFYCFVFFKGQQTVYFLLPVRGSDLYEQHAAFIISAFVGKLLDLGYRLWCQTFCDVFFVDWEKPKTEQKDDDSRESQAASVSVWRKLMAVNIYNDLQTDRLVDINFTLFFIAFFLYGAGLENMATNQPNLEDLDPDLSPVSPVLRFCVSTLCWLIVAGTQLLFQKFIYQRYMEHKTGLFVDLLNLTNISCFLFDERFRCYYLHGESVSKHADVSMEQIFENLKMYQNSATQSRGLNGSGTDSWIAYPARKMRMEYDNIWGKLLAQQTLQKRQDARLGAGGFSRREEAKRLENERNRPRIHYDGGEQGGVARQVIDASQTLNEFLKGFVSNHNTEYPRVIDSRSMMEARFNIPPTLRPEQMNQSVFYPDEGLNFVNCTLMGIEYEVIIFYCLLHDTAMVYARGHWGKVNVSHKTLVDYRFLI